MQPPSNRSPRPNSLLTGENTGEFADSAAGRPTARTGPGRACARMRAVLISNQGPDCETVIRLPGSVRVDEPVHVHGRQSVRSIPMPRHLEIAKPLWKWNSKAFLRTVKDEIRNHASERAFEQVFAFARAILEVTREAAREVYEIIIQKDGASLE